MQKNYCNIPYPLVNPIQSTSISLNSDLIITCSWSWVIATSNILIDDTQRIFYLISLNTVTPRILRLHKLSGIVQRSVILRGFSWRTWRKWWRIAWEPVRLLSKVARLAMQVVVITWGCKLLFWSNSPLLQMSVRGSLHFCTCLQTYKRGNAVLVATQNQDTHDIRFL